MYFADGPAVLTTTLTIADADGHIHEIQAGIIIPTGQMSRAEAAEALGDAIQDQIDDVPGATAEVDVVDERVKVKPTTDGGGTPDEPIVTGDNGQPQLVKFSEEIHKPDDQ